MKLDIRFSIGFLMGGIISGIALPAIYLGVKQFISQHQTGSGTQVATQIASRASLVEVILGFIIWSNFG